jgi:uncharacterized protein
MSQGHGSFVWYDVMANDTKAAQSFYHDVIGWDAIDSGMPDRSYILLSMGPTMIGGLMPIPEEMRKSGHPAAWTGYIGVDDVDDYAKRVAAAGGKIYRDPEDIPGIGRFAVAGDPYGAGFIIFKGASDAVPEQAPPGNPPGRVGWRELHAGNGEGAFAFYSKLFGWTKGDAVDMGEHGVYQVFAIDGTPRGGMMTRMPQTPGSFWLYYFNVDAASEAAERVKKAGGSVVMAPHPVPGGHWIVQCLDPQGAMFAMIASKP